MDTCDLKCDILVIGSGISGICAAIQAGRSGMKTILLEKDEVLGGNSGPNLGVETRGAQHYNRYGQETGIIHEIENEEAWCCAS
ncbi:MAG: FAD-dependent oxidoreductase, partial [Lentisphaeria bacterium]|nr:FAD-dependent oxidoreductase [Lentisphaeria bacterium]